MNLEALAVDVIRPALQKTNLVCSLCCTRKSRCTMFTSDVSPSATSNCRNAWPVLQILFRHRRKKQSSRKRRPNQIHYRADNFFVACFIPKVMCKIMKMFYGTIRHQQAVLPVKVISALSRTL
jgi:hypothetical protein